MNNTEKEKMVEVIVAKVQAKMQKKIDRWERYCCMVFVSCISVFAVVFVVFYFYKMLFDSYRILIALLLFTSMGIHFLLFYQAARTLQMHQQFKLERVEKFTVLNRLQAFKEEVNKENIEERKNLKNRLEQLTNCIASLHDKINNLHPHEKNGRGNEDAE